MSRFVCAAQSDPSNNRCAKTQHSRYANYTSGPGKRSIVANKFIILGIILGGCVLLRFAVYLSNQSYKSHKIFATAIVVWLISGAIMVHGLFSSHACRPPRRLSWRLVYARGRLDAALARLAPRCL